MNKRFKQLAEQAGAMEVKTVLNTPAALSLNGDEIAKFADLILADCIKVVDETPLGYGDYRDQILESMRNSCVESIKYHFGVEK